MTGRQLIHRCRKLGITLSRNGDRLVVDYPSRAVWTPQLREAVAACKPELLAILDGDYVAAAEVMVLRETPLGCWRDGLAQAFDERIATCLESRVPYGEAARTAYIELAKQIQDVLEPEAAHG